jgi:hypothetical protein
MRPAGLVPSRAGSASLGPGSAQVGWPLPFFFLSVSFFVFILILPIFCKSTSIQIKLLPEIFKKTAHYSKSVIKQVFK